jgi:hypothetical protein
MPITMEETAELDLIKIKDFFFSWDTIGGVAHC